MNLKQRITRPWRRASLCAGLSVVVGLVLWLSPLGNGFVHWSFDLPVLLGPKVMPEELVIVQMDEQSYTQLNQPYPHWDRRLHARLLNERLTPDGAKLVVFDVYFSPSDVRTNEDSLLADAIQRHGQVVLAGDFSVGAGIPVATAHSPLAGLRQAARGWGLSVVEQGTDLVIRRHHPGTELYHSLAWAAAEAVGARITQNPAARFVERWLRYYGEGPLPSVSYHLALEKPPGWFKDKIVFIGGKPGTRYVLEEMDEFQTPFRHFGGPFVPGVEIHATTLLNLLHEDSLRRLSPGKELLLLLSAGLVFGWGLSLVRPLSALGLAALGSVAVGAVAWWLFWREHVWFAWMVLAGAQIPCAWLCSMLSYTRQLQGEKQALESRLAAPEWQGPTPLSPYGAAGAAPPASPLPAAPPVAEDSPAIPTIPDYTLLRRIGKGAYGEVWLARNVVRIYHAVKIIWRHQFSDSEPYEREFRGIQRYMPVSLNHPRLVHILYVGLDAPGGHFYYVMELGDDERSGPHIEPAVYSPKNLRREIQRRGRVPVAECVDMALALTSALEYLHQQQLIHRDIKPSNIIFVKGVPKFADIGLVTQIGREGQEVTYVGTEGYIAPEGPGTPAADVFSLGKVLYEAMVGLDRHEFPEVPPTLLDRPGRAGLLALNRVILKACAPQPADRYHSAGEMHADLLRLEKRVKG